MIIKYRNKLLNADTIECVIRCETHPSRLRFECIAATFVIDFGSQEQADKAFECITDAYRWQRQVCDLDDYISSHLPTSPKN